MHKIFAAVPFLVCVYFSLLHPPAKCMNVIEFPVRKDAHMQISKSCLQATFPLLNDLFNSVKFYFSHDFLFNGLRADNGAHFLCFHVRNKREGYL